MPWSIAATCSEASGWAISTPERSAPIVWCSGVKVMPIANFLGRLGVEPGIGQLLEAADIEDLAVAEILQRLAAERRAAARGAIDQHRLVLLEGFVVVRALRVGAKFEHAARDVDRVFELAARLHLARVAHI